MTQVTVPGTQGIVVAAMELPKQPRELELMRAPFPPHQIGKLAKGSKAQMQCPPSEKVNCNICGGWHHPKLVHLDYVGHAALTDRLLDADPHWTWEPLALRDGLPAFDAAGGLWIKLTVCGVTRLGYGNAQESEYKEVGSRDKECIGDALRNAAMRFGAALELWHKGDLHIDEKPEDPKPKEESPGKINEVNLALEGLTPEVVKALRVEAKKIEGDFYAISAKAAHGSWTAFEKVSSEAEVDACWKLIDTKVKTGIRKFIEVKPRYPNALGDAGGETFL